MSVIDKTLEEVMESVNGFDELAVEKHFDGMDLYTDPEARPVMRTRALIFVHLRHSGKTDTEARSEAMSLPVGAIDTYFADDEEIDPDDPVSESGKDVEQPASAPNDSPDSAS